MPINPTHYEIEGLEIEWGKPINEVRPLLDHLEKFQSHEGWASVRCKCHSVFGLKTNEANIRAPFEDRPVLQVQYELVPIKPGFLEKLHSPYLKQLESVLGKPTKTENLYSKPSGGAYSSGSVVYSATWLSDDIRISLSVYGGTRINDSGPSAARIFMNWINEVKAAKPFREKNQLFEKLLTEHIHGDIISTPFKLKDKQRPFSVAHYELSDPHIAEKDNLLRSSQCALYKKELFQTPEPIQTKLNEYEVCFYKIPALNKSFVSNKWDTVFLNQDDENALTLNEMLPARGAGGLELDVKELKIEDETNSTSLLNLVQLIEKETGIKVTKEISYDD